MIDSEKLPAEEVQFQSTIDSSLKCRALSFLLVTICVLFGLAIYLMFAYLSDLLNLASLGMGAFTLLILILLWLYFVRNIFSIVDRVEIKGNELFMHNVSGCIIANDACRNVDIDNTAVDDLQISIGGYSADLSQIADDKKANIIRILEDAREDSTELLTRSE